jgi:hypothetical protein
VPAVPAKVALEARTMLEPLCCCCGPEEAGRAACEHAQRL